MVLKTPQPVVPHPTPPDGPDYHNGIYYPYEDGVPLAENERQAEAINYLYNALVAWLGELEDARVIKDMFVYYAEGDPSSVFAPDIGVIFGVQGGNHPRYSWMAWRENGVLPSLIIEVASPNTWTVDATSKRDTYQRIGIDQYWRHDPVGDLSMPVLIGERLLNGRYEPIEVVSDDSGILRAHSELLGLDFCVRPDGELRLYDPRNREWLLSPTELAEAHQREALRRRRAEEALEASEAEVRALREQIARMQG